MSRLSDYEKLPRGGADAWDQGPGGALLTGEFFGAGGDSATATVTGAAADALAGTVEATGAGQVLSPSAEAQSAAGELSGTGLAIAGVMGAAAAAQAGVVTANGGGVIPFVPSGGGPRRQERPKFLGELFQQKPKLRIAAAATLPSAEVQAVAGEIAARGAKSARIRLVSSSASAGLAAVKAVGMARVSIKAAVIGARPNTAVVHGASITTAANETKASGLGFSDAELAALIAAYDQAA
jgi:hypothetical protein